MKSRMIHIRRWIAIDKAEGVKFLRMENNTAVYSVGSENYRFKSTLP